MTYAMFIRTIRKWHKTTRRTFFFSLLGVFWWQRIDAEENDRAWNMYNHITTTLDFFNLPFSIIIILVARCMASNTVTLSLSTRMIEQQVFLNAFSFICTSAHCTAYTSPHHKSFRKLKSLNWLFSLPPFYTICHLCAHFKFVSFFFFFLALYVRIDKIVWILYVVSLPSKHKFAVELESHYIVAWPIVTTFVCVFFFFSWKEDSMCTRTMPWTSSVIDANDFRTNKTFWFGFFFFLQMMLLQLIRCASLFNRIDKENSRKRKKKQTKKTKKW